MASDAHQSSAKPLAYLYAALVVYASLHPFHGWRATNDALFAFVAAPWPRWWTGFDVVANLLGYVPLGALIFGSLVRSGHGAQRSLALAWLVPSALSLVLESTQNFLTLRVASNVDLLFNSLGAAGGAGVAFAVHRLGWVDRWQSVRERWFIVRSSGGLALMVLWPVGLLFPTPVALGLGRGLPRLHEPLTELLEFTSLSQWLSERSWPAADLVPISAAAEVATIALGLVAPCLVAFAITPPGIRRLAVVLIVAASGVAITTLSTALNFGPQHAFAWLTASALLGLVVGALFAVLACRLSIRTCIALATISLTALVVAVAQAPEDPYFSQSLQAWEQGDFIRFHGAAQWVGWLWPFVALLYLLLRTRKAD